MVEIEIIQGDITKLNVDAIVNAANCSLLGGGGVDGAIHRAAGPELLQACIPLNGCETGEAKITPGFRLPAKFVIHTPGPIFRDGNHGEPALLESCYRNCLKLAEENECATVAFPAISTGVYGYPWHEATEIAVKTVRNFPAKTVKKVTFCCFSADMAAIYREVFNICK
ncbi:MAG: O-acetyl-ADP-ribose deacetylase [Fibrobacter sp.]|nr:O-acetyl-ADP-ribose deacetylase [Fibrobacter sp.]